MTATKQLYIDKMNEVDATYPIELNSVKQQLAEAATKDELSQVASPLVASLVAQMTDTTRVYVYTGAEGGYTSGNWYYHNGTAWVSGGLYQSSGIGTGAVTSTKLSDAAVTPLQTGFLAIGKNLFDKSTITSGYIINGVGALSATAGMFVSDFIPSAALTGYIKKYATGAITYYDSAELDCHIKFLRLRLQHLQTPSILDLTVCCRSWTRNKLSWATYRQHMKHMEQS